jgi:hypothetical protein
VLLLFQGWKQGYRLLPVLVLELVFNLYPPRPWASLLLQAAHWIALLLIFTDGHFRKKAKKQK